MSSRWNPTRPVADLLVATFWFFIGGVAGAQPTSVVNSPHNLSASGPGAVRASMEDQVCIFCHAPHNSSPVQPLWNRTIPTEAYTIYSSRALEAQPGQPTGMSKMCLSCHDGTIALGSVVSRTLPIVMSGGVTTMPQGTAHIGTDLSDDHPISFRYDTSLAIRNSRLKDPAVLPPETRLDSNSELQCSSCHDAHNNSLGKFLVMRNDSSQLCTSCHQMGATQVSGHAQCYACHQPHSAPSGPYLLRARNQTQTCLACHDGAHAPAQNIAQDISKPYSHDTDSPVDPPGTIQEHATCTSCHDPHTMGHGSAAPPTINPNQGRIAGINISGVAVSPASYEYETCFRCHADGGRVAPSVSRLIVQTNTRLEFSTTAASFHPVAGPGRGSDVPSLRPGYTTSSIIGCSDCHTSDTGPAAGGSGPGGVHGSNRAPLLASNYTTTDFTSESVTAYALCYQCHERTSILSNQSFSAHSKHIVDQRVACATCHDSHGIASAQGTTRSNSHLINFDVTVVHPEPGTGRLEYVDKGFGTGQCTLSCHGVVHSSTPYSR